MYHFSVYVALNRAFLNIPQFTASILVVNVIHLELRPSLTTTVSVCLQALAHQTHRILLQIRNLQHRFAEIVSPQHTLKRMSVPTQEAE